MAGVVVVVLSVFCFRLRCRFAFARIGGIALLQQGDGVFQQQIQVFLEAGLADALQQVSPGSDGATVVIDGEEIFVPADLYEVKEEEVDVRGVDVRPHVIEPSYGIDRMIYAVLEHSYHEDEVDGEIRKVMRFPARIAPVQVAVFPLMARDGLDVMAKEIARTLQIQGILAEYDDSGAIGRRYRRQDEIGTPFAVTVDYESLTDQTVTLRDRDSMQQVRVVQDQLADLIPALIRGKSSFSSLI